MEETNKQEPGKALSAEQVTEVAGGDGSCSTTLTVGTSGATFATSGSSPGQVLVSVYDGVVEVTSHVIETVAHAAK
ncbi:MAG TPA: hypothetical protein VH301_11830 [Usitatibacter sp.]|nr:hypothetical protein [Usitatibacter sp.]